MEPGTGRAREADDTERRDDVLDRQYIRGDDDSERRDDVLDASIVRGNEVAERREREYDDDRQRARRWEDENRDRRLNRNDELWNMRMLALGKDVQHYGSVDRRAEGRNEGLLFRDASVHSTAVGAIEEENVEDVTDAPDTGTDQPKA